MLTSSLLLALPESIQVAERIRPPTSYTLRLQKAITSCPQTHPPCRNVYVSLPHSANPERLPQMNPHIRPYHDIPTPIRHKLRACRKNFAAGSVQVIQFSQSPQDRVCTGGTHSPLAALRLHTHSHRPCRPNPFSGSTEAGASA